MRLNCVLSLLVASVSLPLAAQAQMVMGAVTGDSCNQMLGNIYSASASPAVVRDRILDDGSGDPRFRNFSYNAFQCFEESIQRCGRACANSRVVTQGRPLLTFLANVQPPANMAEANQQLSDLQTILRSIHISSANNQSADRAAVGQTPSGYSQCQMRAGDPPGRTYNAMEVASNNALRAQRNAGRQLNPVHTSPGEIQTDFENYALSVAASVQDVLTCRQSVHLAFRPGRARSIQAILNSVRPAANDDISPNRPPSGGQRMNQAQ